MIDSLSESYRDVIRAIGEDPEREGLLDTPQRAAKAMEFMEAARLRDELHALEARRKEVGK